MKVILNCSNIVQRDNCQEVGMKDYAKIVKEYYTLKDIGVKNFRCPYLCDCEQSVYPQRIYRQAETHIGSNYGEKVRVVVVINGHGQNPHDLDNHRKEVEYLDTLPDIELTPQMLGIKQVLRELLDFVVPDTRQIHSYYALTNIANCSLEENTQSIVPVKMYRNCFKYLVDELFLLEPHLIVTIGSISSSALGKLSEVSREVIDFALGNDDMAKDTYETLIQHTKKYLRTLNYKNGTFSYVLNLPNPECQGAWRSFMAYEMQRLSYTATNLIYPSTYSGLIVSHP